MTLLQETKAEKVKIITIEGRGWKDAFSFPTPPMQNKEEKEVMNIFCKIFGCKPDPVVDHISFVQDKKYKLQAICPRCKKPLKNSV